MERITLNREQVEAIYDEFERRLRDDLKDYHRDNLYISSNDLYNMLSNRMQGVYGTIKAIVPKRNWQDIVQWTSLIEKERDIWNLKRWSNGWI